MEMENGLVYLQKIKIIPMKHTKQEMNLINLDKLLKKGGPKDTD